MVKIAPDMDEVAIEQVVECIVREGMDGVIATNTTLSRDAVKDWNTQKKPVVWAAILWHKWART